MSRSLGWQPLLLVVAFLLAISLAAGGWLLGRSRWQMRREETQAGSIPSSSANADGNAQMEKPTAAPDASGDITLDLSLARRAGELKTTEVDGQSALIGWSSPDDTATWQFQAARSGFYRAEL